ncbi:hypothetical protein DOTSEDRAFT_67734 [Dothistroma septosporum NZE10]|uniref:BHLH domain-containing protein n=1 Tax=Dothistroma septosporum (strain NZE10 / CBS 128990) TaxID=675120 RepID=N1Q2B9_DOTSN|nr:hypothetical protein DOTSEDRAFT_67734 [Dothistroma septosporum NZE10]
MAQQAWARPDDLDPMAQMSNDLDDLGNLFEFGDIDLSIPTDAAQYGDHMQQQDTHPTTPFDEISEAQAIAGTAAQDFGAHGQYAMSQASDHGQQQHQFATPAQTSHPFPADPLYQPAMHQQFQQQFQCPDMQGYPLNQHIPPTPNSLEMHGEVGRFLQQQIDPQQRALLEQRYQLRKEDAIAFTPMVSPAGTPQYNVQPEYTVPGAYFSPLTSPMLHAQNAQNGRQQHQQGYYTNPSTAPSSNATSPLDPLAPEDMEGIEMSLNEAAKANARMSSRRKNATPRSAGPLGRVKQSPIQKAIKRKSGTMLSSLVPPRESDGGAPRSGSAQPQSAGLQMPRTDSSQDGSISPEPLSEALMAPPPRPGSSLTQSPALAAQRDAANGSAAKAATPKTILSMRSNQQSGVGDDSIPANDVDDRVDLEDLQLPAAAAAPDAVSRRSLLHLDTRVTSGHSTESTPRLSARKTPKLGPNQTPASARPPSATGSPSFMGSPMTASTPGALLKDRKGADAKGGRGNKKRGSVSASNSSMVSPALRPRISPSIKPLLPEGAALHSPQHALMLASKSNYQNLLEGNQLPGVSYPEHLSTGLTSKRTSHKVAEQGRRNRINEALKEMQSLLPKSATPKICKDNSNSDGSPEAQPNGDSKESKEDATAKSNNSKAATVESANEYIRKLQTEIAMMQQLKQENEEMKRKLESIDENGDTKGSSPTTSSSNAKSESPAPYS